MQNKIGKFAEKRSEKIAVTRIFTKIFNKMFHVKHFFGTFGGTAPFGHFSDDSGAFFKQNKESKMNNKVFSAGLFGIDAFLVEVESFVAEGVPKFDIVGLPDAAVRESRDRVRSAIVCCGYEFSGEHVTVNLAPADIKKSGVLYDVPIFLSLLMQTNQLSANTKDFMFVGELSLSGDIRPAAGVLPMVIKARELGFKGIFIPEKNAPEGAVVDGIEVYPANHIGQIIDHVRGAKKIHPVKQTDFPKKAPVKFPDFSEVCGQEAAKRALEVAAAGGHNVLLIGPPGSGKSMLAKRLPGILPDMTFEESIETTKIHSIAGVLPDSTGLISNRPFRSPHHSVSPVALAGGGTFPKPGEVSLAHNGVLFLDELPEFTRSAMEVLRQPLEDGKVVISRAAASLSYPCEVMLVAAMNPCPCGNFGHPKKRCVCSSTAVSKYLNRVSGPLLDRIDIHIEVPPVEFEELSAVRTAEPSSAIKQRVNEAREIQRKRFKGCGISCNASITPDLLPEICKMTDGARDILEKAFDRLGLSGRAYDRILKVARTSADLEHKDVIDKNNIMEAIQYRSLDRKYWNK